MMQSVDLYNNILPILKSISKIIDKYEKELWSIYYITDCEIAKDLSLDIDVVRYCLNRMQSLSLVVVRDSVEPNRIKVKEITPEGRLVLKGIIPLDVEYNTTRSVNSVNVYHGNIGIANMTGGSISDSAKVVGCINEDKPSSPELKQVIDKIEEILAEQEEEFNPNTEKGRQRIASGAIEQIENNPGLGKRILSSSEKGLITYMQAKFINPVQSAFLAALEDWQKTKTNE